MTRPPTPSATGIPGVISLAGFDVVHGVTTRTGGTSTGAYASLNLGLSSGDEREVVERNRDRLLAHLGVDRSQVCAFNQVHGARVLVARPGWFEEDADAAVSDDPDLLLVVSAADCFPVLFHDPVTGAVGAAHCGWRGTEARLAAKVVEVMQQQYGTRPADLKIAVGPGIRGGCYQVAAEVAERFMVAGFPAGVVTPAAGVGRADGAAEPRTTQARYLLDLEAAIAATLAQAGVPADNVAWLGRCTHCEPEVFYSHRRDAGRTGRLWAFIRAAEPRSAAVGAGAQQAQDSGAGRARQGAA